MARLVDHEGDANVGSEAVPIPANTKQEASGVSRGMTNNNRTCNAPGITAQSNAQRHED